MDVATARAAPSAVALEADLLAIYPALYRRLTLVLRDAAEAEDVAQSAFERAMQGRGGFRSGDLRAWFYTIGLRLAFNELRRRQRAHAVSIDAVHGAEPAWAMRTEPDLWLALGELPLEQRSALVLSTLEGYTHAEIGSILGVPEGTVSSWLSRSKARLREVLGEAP
jgi:RNA polymerase sigma-70 factor (ECF subfamily)